MKQICLSSVMTQWTVRSSRSHPNPSRPNPSHTMLQASHRPSHLVSSDFLRPCPPCHGLRLPRNLPLPAIHRLSPLSQCARSPVLLLGLVGGPQLQKIHSPPHCRLMHYPLTEEILLRQYLPWVVIRN